MKVEPGWRMDEAFKDAIVLYPKSWGCHQYLADQGVPEEDRKRVGMDILNKYKDWVCTEKRMIKPDVADLKKLVETEKLA